MTWALPCGFVTSDLSSGIQYKPIEPGIEDHVSTILIESESKHE